MHGRSVIAKLANVGDRDAAAEFVDFDIVVPREELPDTEKLEYYWTDLEGMQVVHRDGRSLVMGKFILDVDLAKGVISVDWEWD
jgi:16S rRNA processing protein RimM